MDELTLAFIQLEQSLSVQLCIFYLVAEDDTLSPTGPKKKSMKIKLGEFTAVFQSSVKRSDTFLILPHLMQTVLMTSLGSGYTMFYGPKLRPQKGGNRVFEGWDSN